MGILYSNADLMIRAKRNGASFDNILTIGHLKLFLTKKEIKQLIKTYNLNIEASSFDEYTYSNKFFEIFLEAKNVQSLDYSDYEKCDVVHDMNQNIGREYYEKYDVVVDGGTLEHVFNFPVAISNCMQMLKEGGNLFVFTMANNHMGHGFYQFSPELFFRTLNEDNGFEIVDILLEEHKYPGAELSHKTDIYKVEDPYKVKGRVGLVSKSPVMLLVQATRKKIKPLFDNYPVQSDYSSLYESHGNKITHESFSGVKDMIKKLFLMLPKNMQDIVEGHRQLYKYSFKNTSFYKKNNQK
ncbi:hypothetical protein [Sulfurovum sp.]|uniref:hypothetical protein n=1 Tax=Sulfurovum sp. TaxID=1969726 RepID=UPI0035692F5E